jgi:hypothetical protein
LVWRSTSDHRLILDVKVEPHVRPGHDQVGEQGDGLGPADACGLDLRRRQPRDPAHRVGYPVERLVVEGDNRAVGGGVHVRLQVGVAESDRVLECLPGVLRKVAGAAPVREGQRARMIKVTRGHGPQY